MNSQTKNSTAVVTISKDEANLRQTLRDIIYPPFKTHEFETARTKDGYDHMVSMVEYDVTNPKRGFPFKVTGYVKVGISLYKMQWDRNGKAYHPLRETNLPHFDLIREDEKEIQSGKSFLGSFALAIFIIIICSIF